MSMKNPGSVRTGAPAFFTLNLLGSEAARVALPQSPIPHEPPAMIHTIVPSPITNRP